MNASYLRKQACALQSALRAKTHSVNCVLRRGRKDGTYLDLLLLLGAEFFVVYKRRFGKIGGQSNKPSEGNDMKETIRFKLNGKPTTLDVDGDRKLLWVLRTDLGLTGTKYGCGMSLCGACTVVINKEAVRSCSVAVREVSGKDVTTIEGLAKGDKLHPLQSAFAEQGAVQCGFCTPGMIMNAYALLLKNPKLTRDEIINGMENNLCRCSAHQRIVRAIESVSTKR